jgi:hypothetical protein
MACHICKNRKELRLLKSFNIELKNDVSGLSYICTIRVDVTTNLMMGTEETIHPDDGDTGDHRI